MYRHWQCAVLVGILGFVGGCSFGPVNTPPFSDKSRVRHIDPNDGPIKVVEISVTDPNTGEVRRTREITFARTRIHRDLKGQRTFSVKYDRSRFWASSQAFVPIEMPDGRRYSAMLDTGFFGHLYVSDILVNQCDLPVYPIGQNQATGCDAGLCDIPTLWLGKLTIANPQCVYEHRQWQLQFLGIPLLRSGMILIGLDLMRTFPYLLFDNIGHEVVFGLYDEFEPDDLSKWVSLPFVLEEIDGNRRMTTRVSLGQGQARVQFDTGGSKPGLILSRQAWNRLEPCLHAQDKGHGKTTSYQFGRLACHRYVVPWLSIDRLNLNDARIDVLPDGSPGLLGLDGSLSLDYFKNTVVVLDFKQNVIWIKQP